ncbi:hypothetical protein [Streptomyces sp. NPDC016845]|uniref:hypothetical protein n=1 Tax=Streptomyces sp. NPDC016845 TaxID=3364972 RepID=UPI00378DB9E2
MISERSRIAHNGSAERLARRVLDALEDVGHTTPAAAHLESAVSLPPHEQSVAVAAVRMLGADVLAPHALTGSAPPPEEGAAVALALDALPPARPAPAAPPDGDGQPWTMAWIDWSVVTVLARLDPATATPAAPVPQVPPQCDPGPERRRPPTATAGGPAYEGWVPWSVRMSQLSSLALPGLDGPVHEAARSGLTGLARGATRAVLRRDFPTAARITRWLAWAHAERLPLPLDPAPLTEHIALLGGGGRLALEIAIARRLLGLGPA